MGIAWGQSSDNLACPLGTIVGGNTMTFTTTNFTILHEKGTDDNFAAYSPWRVYTNNTVTFTGGANVKKITSIVITATTNAYATAAVGTLTVVTGTGTVSGAASGTTVTITVTGNDVTSIRLKPNAQTRWSNIVINYELNSAGPTLTSTESSITGLDYMEGSGPSASQSFKVSGSNLSPASGNITVAAPTNFQVSTDNSTFSNSVNLSYSSGSFTNKDVYARLISGNSVGNYSGNITISGGGASDVTVSLSGTVTAYSSNCGSETFTNSNATASYLNGNFVGDNGVTWTYVASRDEDSYGITGKGIMLRRLSDESKVTSSSVSGGIGNFTCSLKKGFTGAGNRQVELFVNGVSQGTSIAWDNNSVQTFTVSNINISGNVIIEIRNIKSYQVVVDDISWTCYSAAPQPPQITSSLTKSTEYGSADTYTITADYLPTSFNATSLPAGLSVNTSTGVISGTVTAAPGTYNVTISATNAQGTDNKTLVWTVTAKNLTISGLTGTNKVYDRTTTATLGGTAALVGVITGDVVSLSGTPVANFNTKDVGTGKPITVSGYSLSGADAGKYTLSQPTGLTANITKKALTVTGATAQNKVWDGTTAATITGATLVGVISPDVVSVSGGGTFAQSNAGTNITVTANLSLGGIDADNYSLTQPAGLKADITKANPVFTTSTISITVGGTYTLPGANISSNSNGTLTYSITGGGHATYTAPSTLNGVSVGTETLTVNQAAGTNHNAGSTTVTVNVTEFVYISGDVRPLFAYTDLSYGGTSPYNWEEFNGTSWVNRSASPQNTKPSGRIVIDKKGIGGGGSASNTYNDIVIIDGGELILNDNNASPSNFLYANKKITVEKGGILKLNGDIKLVSTNQLIVESEGEFIINNSSMINSHAVWGGVENFKAGSTVTITNWNWGAAATNSTLFQNSTTISSNAAGYKFGNLLIDAAPTTDWTLVGSSSLPDLKICENNLEIYNSGAKFISGTSNTSSSFIVGGDLIIYDGWFNFGTTFSGNTNFTNHFTINGDFIDISDDQLKLHYRVSGNGEADGSVTIFGDFIIGDDVDQITNQFNKKFILKGGTAAEPKIIEVGTPKVLYVPIEVASGYRVLTKSLSLGTQSSLLVKNGATFDFGFDNSDNPLYVLRNASQNSMSFTTEAGSTIKITSPDGITTTAGVGNVQIPVAGRTYDVDGIYHYIGKTNQVSGNGLPSAASNKKVIIELADDTLTFQPNGLNKINSDGYLEIRKGIVYDNATGSFEDGSTPGKLTMSGGRYILDKTGIQPGLSGTYNLSAGVVEFTNSGATAQTIRNTVNYKYQNIEVSGTNVGNSGGNIALRPNGTFTVKSGGIFTIRQNSIKCYNAVNGQVTSGTGCGVTVENNAIFRTGNGQGFSGTGSAFGAESSSIDENITNIILANGSTVDYLGEKEAGQNITKQSGFVPGNAAAHYSNLTISGDVLNELTGTLVVNDVLEIKDHTNGGNSYTGKLVVAASANNAAANVVYANKGIKVTSGDFILENNAQLMQDAVAVNAGDIQVKRAFTFSALRKEYNFLSAPVDDPTRFLKTSIYTPNPPSVQTYIESTYYFEEVNGRYIQAKGYAVKEPASGTQQGLFTGVASNGNIPYTLQKSVNGGGYNLVGNPYPSNLDIVKLYEDEDDTTGEKNKAKIEPEFHFWDNNGNTQYTQDGSDYEDNQYATFNASAGTGNAAQGAGGAGRIPTRYVKVGTGFMVQAKSNANGKSLNFRNEYRVAGNNEIGFFGKPNGVESDEMDRYWLTLTTPSDVVTMNAVVYLDGGSNGFGIEDSESQGASDDIYSIADNQRLAIQGRAPFQITDVVPLGVKLFNPGYHYISLHQAEGVFANGTKVYIKDKLLNKTWDLTKEPYRFLSKGGEFKDRFEIVYLANAFGTSQDLFTRNEITVTKNGSDIRIDSSLDKLSTVEIFSLNGLPLYQNDKLNANQLNLPMNTFGPQLLIIRVKTDTGETQTRKWVNK